MNSISRPIKDSGPYESLYRSTNRLWSGPGKLVLEFVEGLNEETSNRRALDLGAGEGDNAILLACHGFDVTAIEVSPTAVARLAERIATLPAAIRERLRVHERPVDVSAEWGKFNLVVAYGLLHCFRDAGSAAAVARHCCESLAEGGTLILSALTDEVPIDSLAHAELSDCFLPSVEILRSWFGELGSVHEEREIIEEQHGAGIPHRHAIIRAIYRKKADHPIMHKTVVTPIPLLVQVKAEPVELIAGPETVMIALGSCFAEHFAARFVEMGLSCYHRIESCNHFNPVSLADQLDEVAEGRALRAEHVYPTCYLASDDPLAPLSVTTPFRRALYAENSESLLKLADALDREFRAEVTRASIFVYTLGTADVIRNHAKDRVWCSGNHIRSTAYRLDSLSVDEIVDAILRIRRRLHEFGSNPKSLILTISPQRYFWSSYLVEAIDPSQLAANSLAKAKLRVAVDIVVRQCPDVRYFPAYEISIDELRWVEPLYDGHEITHVSALTPTVVIERFFETYAGPRTRRYVEAWLDIERIAKHAKRAAHLSGALDRMLLEYEAKIRSRFENDPPALDRLLAASAQLRQNQISKHS